MACRIRLDAVGTEMHVELAAAAAPPMRRPIAPLQFETFVRRSGSQNRTLRIRSLALLIALLSAASARAAPRRVIFVDNRVPPGGAGSALQPFATLATAMGAAREFDVIFLAETDQPYPG